MSEPNVIDAGTFTDRPAASAAEPTLSKIQFEVLAAEVRGIETYAVHAAIVAADNTSSMGARLDQAIASGQVSKDLLTDLSSLLCAQEKAVLAAIGASNLARRLNADLAPGA